MKKWAMTALLCLLPAVSFAAGELPQQIVGDTSRALVEAVGKPEGARAAAVAVVDAAMAHVDLPAITAVAVGRAWPRATPEQQGRLLTEVRTKLTLEHFLPLYTKPQAYKGLQVAVLGVVGDATAGEQTVKTTVTVKGRKAIAVDYRFVRGAAGWKMSGFNVDGIDQVNKYAVDFATIVRHLGVDGLIQQLHEQNSAWAASLK